MYTSPVITVASCLDYDEEMHIEDGILLLVFIVLLRLLGEL
jgi:hypothetical protein